ncbi:penicillin-binding protein 2 [Patescibacteria group bacterium]|nr:penicillin-binding protein 2 [Patescibacteria group bacterium]
MNDDKDVNFGWDYAGGMDLKVSTRRGDIAHEILYEDDATKIKDQPMYLGEPIPILRFWIAMFISIIFIGVLLGRAFWMQGISYDKYAALSDRNRLRYEVISPSRGMIKDREGIILADNVSTFDLSVVPIDLPQDAEARNEALGRVARQTGTPISEISSIVDSSIELDQSMILVRDLPYDQAVALKVDLSDYPAFKIESGDKRRYVFSADVSTLSHILGYTGKISPDELLKNQVIDYRQTDLIGKVGVEKSYEEFLRGVPGERVIEVDAYGHEKRIIHETQAINGSELILTIDGELQKKTEIALKRGLEMAEAKHGVAIVMDPRDGAVLAIASWPAYDNNIFAGKVSSTIYASLVNDEDKPFLARAWAGLYPSGSTIKPVYAVAALSEGVITAKTSIVSTGGIYSGSHFFPDWLAGGHGVTNVRKAIAMSVNTFFYYICGGKDSFVGMGVLKMGEWLRRFGFGSVTGLDIPGESDGFVPTPEWKEERKNEKWYVGDTYNLSIGQGDLLVTPLQIALSTAEIANGGHKVTPHVFYNSSSTVSDDAIADNGYVETVRLGMRDTVTVGSGRALANLPVNVAGKTGTAQWSSEKPNHAWFTGFAPFDDPEVVVTVLLEQGDEGSRTAVPVVKEILQAWLGIRQRLD